MKSTINLTDTERSVVAISNDDKLRALRKEPWHFQDHHIVLYTPTVLQNVTPESMVFSPFWVQAYRLPFLSKTRSLAKSLGNIIGEFLEVHEDSSYEGWGPFLRFQVRMDIRKPLLRGCMITLPKVRDEFWMEFRYERLPEYCMECGIIDHSFNKCPVHLENMDNGTESELAYDPSLKGSALPSSNYNRYRTDFSKGHAWPLITHLARNTLTAMLPQLNARPLPSPTTLLFGESSTENVSRDRSVKKDPPTIHLANVYTLDIGDSYISHPFATYPPDPSSITTTFGSHLISPISTVAYSTMTAPITATSFQYGRSDFTWKKNRKNPNALRERLDWCFTNNIWNDTLVLPKVSQLDYYGSDHRAIFVNIIFDSNSNPERRRSRFHFEKLWLKEQDCADIILSCWTYDSLDDPTNALITCLSRCASDLQSWHNGKFSNFQRKITAAQNNVKNLHVVATPKIDHSQKVQTAESLLDELLANEEQYWQQHSRIDWLQSGDRNTKFFHAKASARNATNKIRSLQDENGYIVTSKDGISNIVSSYFQDLFTASEEDHWALFHVLSTIPTTITAEHNSFLLKEFSSTDVLEALKSMGGDRSPGPDGMSTMFYQQNWDIVGSLVTKVILPHVISGTQSSFLPNRLITDNVLVGFELVHSLKHKRSRKGYAALKLDMSKAFDRVEWSFIAIVMGKIWFNVRWISLIMICLHTTQFSFLINGVVSGLVTPQQGLRQGDPLFSYLFLIYSEGLSRLLRFEESIGRLKGLSVSRHAPVVTHLFFADDSLLFCQADGWSCGALKRALDIYIS
uniref:Reverse transcriptase domain-containing protein n=1 Tax=Cannabis sativa TaxID=3483 RepID=A0A803PAV4_CANSA